MLRNKKLLSIVMALAFVLSAMGLAFAPVSASAAISYLEGSAVPPSTSRDGSTYEIRSPDQAQSIEVTLIVEAGNEYNDLVGTSRFWVSHDITLSQPSGYYTVTDLLVDVHNDPTYDLYFYKANGVSIDVTTDYVNSVKHAGTTWEEGQLTYDGWEFRVNDKFPVYNDGAGWLGASILDTNIKDGDVIHLFYDFPADYNSQSGSFAANYVRGILLESSASSLTVQLQGHTTFIYPVPPYTFYVDNYKNVQAGVTAYLYDASGNRQIASAVSDVNGRVTFSGSFGSGTYVVITKSEYQPGYDPADISDNTYITLTGAYSKIVIQ
jgi:hypothetical protein